MSTSMRAQECAAPELPPPSLHALLADPIRHAMSLLWAVSLLKLGANAGVAHSLAAWPWAALAAAFAAAPLVAALRRPELLPVPALLLLAAVLSFAAQLGASSGTALAIVAAVYGLGLWHAGTALATGTGAARIALVLGTRVPDARLDAALTGGLGRASLAATAVGLCAPLLDGGAGAFWRGELTWGLLAAAIAAAWLLAQIARGHRAQGYIYALLAALALAGLVVHVGLRPPASAGLWGLVADPVLPVHAALLALLVALAALRPAVRHDADPGPWPGALRRGALGLAATAAILVATSLPAAHWHLGSWTAAGSLALAGIAILIAAHGRDAVHGNTAGTAMLALSSYWLAVGLLGTLGLALAPVLALVLVAQGLLLAGSLLGQRAWGRPLALAFEAASALGAALALALAYGLGLSAYPAGDPVLPVVFLLLLGPGLHACRRQPHPAAARGFLAGLLAVSALMAALLAAGFARGLELLVASAFGLGVVAPAVLQAVNRRWPQRAVDAAAWPWFGLLYLAWAVVSDPGALVGELLLPAALAAYALAARPPVGRAVFDWLAALALALLGVRIAAALAADPQLGALIALLWLNALLALAMRRADSPFDWRGGAWAGLPRPLATVSLGGFGLALGLVVTLALARWATIISGHAPQGVALALAVTASFAHALVARPSRYTAHGLLAATGTAVAMLALWAGPDARWVAPAAGLWCLALLSASRWLDTGGKGSGPAARLRAALVVWTWLAPALTVAAMVAPGTPGRADLGALALLTVFVALHGWSRRRSAWIAAACVLGIADVHGLWLVDHGLAGLARALPYTALSLVGLVWLARLARALLAKRRARGAQALPGWDAGATAGLDATLARVARFAAALALVELAVHGYALVAALAGVAGPPPALGGFVAPAVLAALALLVAHFWLSARAAPDGPAAYAAALIALAAGCYLRLLWAGLAPFSVADTAAVLAASALALVLGRVSGSAALLHVALALPPAALLGAAPRPGSVPGAATLLALSVHYLLAASLVRRRAALYLAALSLNGAVYLWLPVWAAGSGVLQLYAVPAAITVLGLAHLHRRELRRDVLNAVRLAALALLYASATADVFLQPALWVFALALALGIAGVAMGVGLRIRAFLYAGVAFLLVNVLGQLVAFYPDERLGRALLLMGVGIAVTAGMVAFNMQREAILARIRVARADLAAWD